LYGLKGIDFVKEKISKWKFTEIQSLWDRQYHTEGFDGGAAIGGCSNHPKQFF